MQRGNFSKKYQILALVIIMLFAFTILNTKQVGSDCLNKNSSNYALKKSEKSIWKGALSWFLPGKWIPLLANIFTYKEEINCVLNETNFYIE